jgi:phosphate transport system substrate-binding protein
MPAPRLAALGTLVTLALAACTDAPARPPAPPRDDAVPDLAGAGATFPYPVYTRWFTRHLERTGERITYRSIGSAAGVRALIAGETDFAATDVPLDSAERRALALRDVRLVPMVVGGVAVTYHLPDARTALRLEGTTLADILLGRITRWDDARLAALNPDLDLPAAPIRVVHRADTSGTTYIVTDYLARVSADWAAGPGRGRAVAWPVGQGERGNEAVAAAVKTTPYTLGLVEAVYAMQTRLPAARIRNHAGAWVTPQTGNLREAAAAMLPSVDDTIEFATSIADAPGPASYPIASLSWLVVPRAGVRDPARAASTVRFVRWALAEGDADALALGYAPLPPDMRRRVLAALAPAPR